MFFFFFFFSLLLLKQLQRAAHLISIIILPIKPTKSTENESLPIIFINLRKFVWKGKGLKALVPCALKDSTFVAILIDCVSRFWIRYPDDRPNIVELSHPFFKQAKRTTLAENLSLTGIDKYNCTKLSSGKTIWNFHVHATKAFDKIRTYFYALNTHQHQKMLKFQMRILDCRVKWLTWALAASLNGTFERRRLSTWANENAFPMPEPTSRDRLAFENAQQASIIDITLFLSLSLSLILSLYQSICLCK